MTMNLPLIDKDLPIPQTRSLKKYPFQHMAVGDSFLMPEGMKRQTLSVAAKRYGDKHKMKFVTRMTEDKQIRCWRVS
jgi:hypothetical protein